MLKFGEQFGSAASTAASNNREELPKAQTWANIGYPVEYQENGETVRRFVAMPQGIPLDTQKAIDITTRNASFAAFQAACNACLKSIQDTVAALKPGEEHLEPIGETGLDLQFRRVNDAPAAPSTGADNPFVRPLFQPKAAAEEKAAK